ncbi:defensin-2-like [Calliopsis andreniformis]|uniref:defensin-2-like n=1 Tax=Calliopsis andreniformis TaxID=337506 RepID=UPI003FCEA9BA
MKLLTVFGIFVIVNYVSSATIPVIYDGPIYERKPTEGGEILVEIDVSTTESAPTREARVTCDVLSVSTGWLSLNHSACAVKCIAKRKKGGYCENGNCICRN